jgi:glucose-1-phosphate adenylyltransferase
MKMDRQLLRAIDSNEDEELFQASMGIYVFNRRVLIECLENDLVDFGKHIIPQSIKGRHVSAFIFKGYWEDIGTIRAFYEANLDLTDIVPEYSFFEPESPIYTHPRFLPAAKSTEPRFGKRSFQMDASFPMHTWNAALLEYAALFRAVRRSVTA